jgi:hypothetical protein
MKELSGNSIFEIKDKNCIIKGVKFISTSFSS